ncbi:xylulokinase [Caproicibacter fermentans]|uniref:ATPase n=1 Tax=Caproicibacter fermentans TaxID=2576756 RepID=A0A7G8TEX3_9FIRM|nr:FGGY-family carbohydrate kinase [Caproicibacter fermentans]QNK42164.1 ATPase [Caproicibacter fermentans]
MRQDEIKRAIIAGNTSLGIELGSTKIKAALLTEDFIPAASGSHDWESSYENGVWTYSLEDVWDGLRHCYRNLACDVLDRYGVELTTVGCIGFSGMMHGYLPFDRNGLLLTPFRTWQNTATGPAAKELSELFQFNVPQRWSVAHLYQAVLNEEPHVKNLAFLTTLAGYVHWQMTGRKVLGIGDASGMFPIDSGTCDYDAGMLTKFQEKVSSRYSWKLKDLLPRVLLAGEDAGTLTEEGAKKLDPSGRLRAGIPVCPPEGDAGTGMAATNSVTARTGNVSAGTSIFSMVVLERPLTDHYPEIDLVATPAGVPVAMVHCNNCTGDMNLWAELLGEFAEMMGIPAGLDEIYPAFYRKALEGDPDCGGLLLYNYLAGEPVAGVAEGRPMLIRSPKSRFSLANFCRANIYAALAALKLGMDLLAKENVQIDRLTGHGGLFRHAGAGARFLAAAVNAPVSTMETAAAGGPYGMALLAAYSIRRKKGESLEEFLSTRVYAGIKTVTTWPDPADAKGFEQFLKNFKAGLAAEKAAAECMK